MVAIATAPLANSKRDLEHSETKKSLPKAWGNPKFQPSFLVDAVVLDQFDSFETKIKTKSHTGKKTNE